MSKRVLIFDEPTSCRKCPCINGTGEACNAARRPFSEGTKIQIRNGDKCRPLWCPAKDLPDYKMDWSDEQGYESGWNDVLDAIGAHQ